VNKPTLFMAGEAGPEAYNFQPLSKGKSGIGGVTINGGITLNVPNADLSRMTDTDWDRVVTKGLGAAMSRGIARGNINLVN
jgi:hypothetical protein